MSASSPSSPLLQRHFQDIAIDGTHLIVRGVQIGGKTYDVRVAKFNQHGELDRFQDKNEEFCFSQINKVALVAKHLFADVEEDLCDQTRFTVTTGGDGDSQVALLKKLKDFNPEIIGAGKDLESALQNKSPEAHAMIVGAFQVHQMFFGTSAVLTDPSEMMKPKEVALYKTRSVAVDSEEEDRLSVASSESSDFDLEGTTVNEDGDEDAESVSSRGSFHSVLEGTEPVAEASGENSNFLEGLTVENLQNYSRSSNQTSSAPNIVRAYEALERLIQDPNSDLDDDQKMLNWLLERSREMQEEGTFEEKIRQLIGFIAGEDANLDPLVVKLLQIHSPTIINSI